MRNLEAKYTVRRKNMHVELHKHFIITTDMSNGQWTLSIFGNKMRCHVLFYGQSLKFPQQYQLRGYFYIENQHT